MQSKGVIEKSNFDIDFPKNILETDSWLRTETCIKGALLYLASGGESERDAGSGGRLGDLLRDLETWNAEGEADSGGAAERLRSPAPGGGSCNSLVLMWGS